jgi:hypothetical protein
MGTPKYTPESVWEAMQENNRFLTEKLAETDRIMKENLAETERVMKENHAETEQAIKELRESQKETDRLFKETDLKINKLTENVKNLNNDIGGMENSTGLFAEQYFLNCFKKGNKTFFGEHFDQIKKNVHGGKPRTEFHDEYDIVLYNSKTIAIIETKFRARTFHVDDTVDKVKTFRMNFPQFANHQFYLALASMSFDKNVEKKCNDKGIAIVKQEGNMVMIVDDKLTVY